MQQQEPSLISLPVLRSLQQSKTRRMHTRVIWLWLCLLFFALLSALLVCRVLLLLTLALLHLELCTLFAVARALVVELVVLGYDA
jgi:hypothetical protein